MRSLIETLRSEAAADKAAARKTCLEILFRRDVPEADDPSKWKAAAAILGLSSEWLANAEKVLDEVRRLEPEAANLDAFVARAEEASGRAWQHLQRMNEQIEALRTEQGRLQSEANGLRNLASIAQQASNELNKLRAKNPELFGVAVPEPQHVATPVCMPGGGLRRVDGADAELTKREGGLQPMAAAMP
jgi:hypothetical protein